MYRTGQTTFLDFVMGASTFEEFTKNWDLLEHINDGDAELVQQTKICEPRSRKPRLSSSVKQIAADKAVENQRIKEAEHTVRSEAQTLVAQATLKTRLCWHKNRKLPAKPK